MNEGYTAIVVCDDCKHVFNGREGDDCPHCGSRNTTEA